MHQGTLEQIGEPDENLYDPQSLNVARFVVPGGRAFVEGTVVGGNLHLPEGEFAVPHLREALRPYENRRVMFRVTDEGLSGDLRLNQPAGLSSPFPFDPSRILAFNPDTGDRIGKSEPEGITAQAAGQAPAVRDDNPAQGARAVNAWLIGARPPIPVGQEVELGFNIGPVVRDALASAAFSEPDWGGAEEMECDVIVLSDGCDVHPPGQKLPVPRLGTSPSLTFRIRARESGRSPCVSRFTSRSAAFSSRSWPRRSKQRSRMQR